MDVFVHTFVNNDTRTHRRSNERVHEYLTFGAFTRVASPARRSPLDRLAGHSLAIVGPLGCLDFPDMSSLKPRTHGQVFLDKYFSPSLTPRLARVYAHQVFTR